MRALVTGATGFLGSHLVEELLANDYQVSVLVRKTSNLEHLENLSGLTILYGDLNDVNSLVQAFRDQDIIFHNASAFNEWGPYKFFHQHNVVGTKNVVNAALKNSLEKIVYTSTADIYKYDKIDSYNENSKIKPYGNYQKSKIRAEKVLDECSSENGLKISKIRPPGIIGPRNDYMAARIANGVSQRRVPLIGSGNQIKSYVDVRDVAHCLRLAAENENAFGNNLNVTSFEANVMDYWSTAATILEKEIEFIHYPYSIAYFFGFLSEVFGKITFRKNVPRATRYRINYFGKDYIIDSTNARTILKYKPKYNFIQSMKDMLVTWLNKNKGRN